jgi:hypothetical protein
MPDPKDFMPEGSTYVRGYVRGQPPTPKRKLKLRRHYIFWLYHNRLYYPAYQSRTTRIIWFVRRWCSMVYCHTPAS